MRWQKWGFSEAPSWLKVSLDKYYGCTKLLCAPHCHSVCNETHMNMNPKYLRSNDRRSLDTFIHVQSGSNKPTKGRFCHPYSTSTAANIQGVLFWGYMEQSADEDGLADHEDCAKVCIHKTNNIRHRHEMLSELAVLGHGAKSLHTYRCVPSEPQCVYSFPLFLPTSRYQVWSPSCHKENH
jgi:hypothetical protein